MAQLYIGEMYGFPVYFNTNVRSLVHKGDVVSALGPSAPWYPYLAEFYGLVTPQIEFHHACVVYHDTAKQSPQDVIIHLDGEYSRMETVFLVDLPTEIGQKVSQPGGRVFGTYAGDAMFRGREVCVLRKGKAIRFLDRLTRHITYYDTSITFEERNALFEQIRFYSSFTNDDDGEITVDDGLRCWTFWRLDDGTWNGTRLPASYREAVAASVSEFLEPRDIFFGMAPDTRHGRIFTTPSRTESWLQHEIAHVTQLRDEDFANGVVTWEGLNLDPLTRTEQADMLAGLVTCREAEVMQIQYALFQPSMRFDKLPPHSMTRDELIAQFHKNWNRIKSLDPNPNPGYVPWYKRAPQG